MLGQLLIQPRSPRNREGHDGSAVLAQGQLQYGIVEDLGGVVDGQEGQGNARHGDQDLGHYHLPFPPAVCDLLQEHGPELLAVEGELWQRGQGNANATLEPVHDQQQAQSLHKPRVFS